MIYNAFFGFREEPFGITPNPRFFFLSKGHEDALAHLKFGISENKGFVMITCQIGSGKTTLMKYFIDKLDDKTHTSVILNPKVYPLELLKSINRDFGIKCDGSTYDDLIACLNDFLIDSYSKGQKAVIFIDEAQSMSTESLEFVRLLSNLETNTKKLLHIVLLGQPELRDIIGDQKMKQLDQRISVRYHIGPLKQDEIKRYIQHRMTKAGSIAAFPHTSKSVEMIYRYSRGLPRLINIACDRILLTAYSEGQIKISDKIVKIGLKELGLKDNGVRIYILASLIFLLGMILIYNKKPEFDFESILLKTGPDKAAEKTVKKERFTMDSEGMVMVSDPADAKDASFLTLLNHWGEVNLPLKQGAEEIAKERGYSIYSFDNDWEKLFKLNMPCIIHSKEDSISKWSVLLWIVDRDAVVFEPVRGKMIVPVSYLKNSVSGFVMLWKNKYNNAEKILELQEYLIMEGYFKKPKTGVFGDYTKKTLMKFQKEKRIPASGEFDEETMLVMSKDKFTPEIFPREDKKGRAE